jgi:hypothetical protein
MNNIANRIGLIRIVFLILFLVYLLMALKVVLFKTASPLTFIEYINEAAAGFFFSDLKHIYAKLAKICFKSHNAVSALMVFGGGEPWPCKTTNHRSFKLRFFGDVTSLLSVNKWSHGKTFKTDFVMSACKSNDVVIARL